MQCFDFAWCYVTVDCETGFATVWDRDLGLEIDELDSLEEAMELILGTEAMPLEF